MIQNNNCMCMNYFKALILLLGCVFFVSSSCGCVKRSNKYLSTSDTIQFDKSIIPYLINNIDKYQEISDFMIGAVNPYDSNLYLHFNNPGILYAYAIECVLFTDTENIFHGISIKDLSEGNEIVLHQLAEIVGRVRIYNRCIIAKSDQNGYYFFFERLSNDDMVEIKKCYYDWWQKNKNKSIKELRAEYLRMVKVISPQRVWQNSIIEQKYVWI